MPRKSKKLKEVVEITSTEPFQLSEKDLLINKNLRPSDVGKWGFIIDGLYHGFFDCKSKADEWMSYILSNQKQF